MDLFSLCSPLGPTLLLLSSSLSLAHTVLPQRDAVGILFGCCLHLCLGAFCATNPQLSGVILTREQLTPGCVVLCNLSFRTFFFFF